MTVTVEASCAVSGQILGGPGIRARPVKESEKTPLLGEMQLRVLEEELSRDNQKADVFMPPKGLASKAFDVREIIYIVMSYSPVPAALDKLCSPVSAMDNCIFPGG